ncbi:putative chitinase [Chloropicon primus]|uniref:Putative chitinase n=1 Tax=Chloropicon primus TaxID=1764295 RepID=A0A5B8MR89_9CHLO|nr:putative chitinase [Chloropicon primus]|eukprot:QDZ22953.1 putative chitinase [Chloropicon primus]
MKIKREVLAMAWLAVVVAAAGVSGHGLLTKPGGRSFKAWEDTQRGWPYGPRQPEWNPHSMNRGGVCGTSQTDATRNYNNPKDVNGNPFTPPVTDTYEAGQVYDFEFIITAHHYGHVELRLCRDWRRPTQACFDAHPLEFVSDELYGALPDPRHPERGYMAPANHIERRVPPSGGAFEGGMQFRMKFRIPLSIGRCDHCALQWTYVTANSCLVGGYRQYDFPDPSWWAGHLPDCEQTENWPRDGSAFPEQFWNCADVRIVPSGSSTPLPAPAPRPLPILEQQQGGHGDLQTSDYSRAEVGGLWRAEYRPLPPGQEMLPMRTRLDLHKRN